jgi:hypothetical protein
MRLKQNNKDGNIFNSQACYLIGEKKIQNVNLKCILSNQLSPGKLLLPFSENILLSIALQRTEYRTSLCGLVPQTPPYILHLHICKAHRHGTDLCTFFYRLFRKFNITKKDLKRKKK